VPAVALCSLNWASIYAAYCSDADGSAAILEKMWAGYRAAQVFLTPAPAMEMPELANCRAIGPIARKGVPQRPMLLERMGLAPGTRLVMVALGGIATALPLENWPRMHDVAWLFSAPVAVPRDDLFDFSALPLAFIDVLASSDAVLTKPGYGTYTEAVCNAVPLLTLERPDWPETAGLNAWARRYGRLQTIGKEAFESGLFVEALQRLWRQPEPAAALEPAGIEQAAGVLLEMLR
jgi:hypothetical protein